MATDTASLLQAANELHTSGKLAEAETQYRRVLDREPNHAGALHGLGLIAYHVENHTAAVECLRRAADSDPGQPEIWCHLGAALNAIGETEVALRAYRLAISLRPAYSRAHYNLGRALQRAGYPADAVAAYRTALSCEDDDAVTLYNLALALHALDLHAEAEQAARRAVSVKPDYAEAYHTLAIVLRELGRHEEAIDNARRALAHAPSYPKAHFTLASELLLRGRFAEAWPHFEWRLHMLGIHALPEALTSRLWRGETLAGRTILLHAEQGLGDTLQFIRYVPLVKARGARVLVLAPAPLQRLLAPMKTIDELLDENKPLPGFDYYLPVMGLPGVIGTDLQTIPAAIPYLQAPPDLVDQWATRIPRTDGMRIGLVWAGSPTHGNDCKRSLVLGDLAPLVRYPPAKYYSLQIGTGAEQLDGNLAGHLTDLAPAITDMADTAAAISHLDLVITCDTAVAHLAGALGKPVWAFIPAVPDWRWMLERSDSPWYPSMRLFRQSPGETWAPVVARMAEALEEMGTRSENNCDTDR